MDENTPKKAAITAARFVMDLFPAYFTETARPELRADLMEGLEQNGTEWNAFRLIQDIAGQESKLNTTVTSMAEDHPETVIALAEIFASALVTGAGRSGPDYKELAVSHDLRDTELSNYFSIDSAPTLAQFFKPQIRVLN